MQEPDNTDKQAFRKVVPTAIWTLIWIVSLAVARFGPDLLWDGNQVVTWVAIGVNVALGIGWIVVHARYLRRVDDLQRKILTDAMAVALGLGLVGGFAYAAADQAGLVAIDSPIAILAAFMGVVYALASVAGTLRYR